MSDTGEIRKAGTGSAGSARERFDIAGFARRNAVVMLVGLVLVVFPFVVKQSYYQQIMIRVFIYAIAGQAWNIMGGYAGQVSLGQAVFFGAGAYTSAILFVDKGISPWIGLVAGAAVACAIGLAIGRICFGLAGRYFSIATLGIGEIMQLVVLNLSVTRRAVGIYIPVLPSSISHLQFHESRVPYYFLALALLGLICGTVAFLEKSRVGFYWRAIKADQAVAESLGVPSRRYKLMAVAISSGFMGVLGAFYSNYVLVVDPSNTLRMDLSIMFMLIAVAGGVGRLWGPLLGAMIIMPLSELTRVKLGGTGGIDLLVFSSVIVLLVLFEPRGIQGLIQRAATAFRGRGGAHARSA